MSSNMQFDVLALNMEHQLISLASERLGKTLEECTDPEIYSLVLILCKRLLRVCEKKKKNGRIGNPADATDFFPVCADTGGHRYEEINKDRIRSIDAGHGGDVVCGVRRRQCGRY